MSATRNDHWVPVEHGKAVGRRDEVGFSNQAIADMLDRAQTLGFPMGPESPLDDLTVRELQMLVDDLTEN